MFQARQCLKMNNPSRLEKVLMAVFCTQCFLEGFSSRLLHLNSVIKWRWIWLKVKYVHSKFNCTNCKLLINVFIITLYVNINNLPSTHFLIVMFKRFTVVHWFWRFKHIYQSTSHNCYWGHLFTNTFPSVGKLNICGTRVKVQLDKHSFRASIWYH